MSLTSTGKPHEVLSGHRLKSAHAFPCISIVIPALNEECNIGNVVHSVTGQCPEGSKLEVIVVADGSNDHTVKEAERAGISVNAASNS